MTRTYAVEQRLLQASEAMKGRGNADRGRDRRAAEGRAVGPMGGRGAKGVGPMGSG